MMSSDDDLLAYMANNDEDTKGKASIIKRSWTPEEDAVLVAAVEKYGAARWSVIATHLSTGRMGKQCRERWNNHLSPDVKKSEWSEEEDRAILEGVAKMGTCWCDIVKVPALSGRKDNAIKNRFYSLQRRSKRSGQVIAKPSSPLGKRQIEEEVVPDQEARCLTKERKERIVAVATQLAFATEAMDRDRLIAELTVALQQLEQFEFTPDDVSSSPGSPNDEMTTPVAEPFEANQGEASALHRTKKLEQLDLSHDLAMALELPSLSNGQLSPDFSDSDDLSIADTACADLVMSTHVDDTSSRSYRSGSISPISISDSSSSSRRSCSPAGDAPPVSPRSERDVIGASLGGRHAYKALLPQLAIPQRLMADVTIVGSPIKKLRTPTGSVSRDVLPPSSLMRTAPTGTEEPGALFSPISSSSSPLSKPKPSETMDEFIALLGFDDLFDDLPQPSATFPSSWEVATPTPIWA